MPSVIGCSTDNRLRDAKSAEAIQRVAPKPVFSISPAEDGKSSGAIGRAHEAAAVSGDHAQPPASEPLQSPNLRGMHNDRTQIYGVGRRRGEPVATSDSELATLNPGVSSGVSGHWDRPFTADATRKSTSVNGACRATSESRIAAGSPGTARGRSI